jgi:hypothetical protein
MLSACGGGGGGSGGAGVSIQPAPAPLKLTAVAPADGAATGVDAVPTASFDGAPAIAALTPAAFSLIGTTGAVDARVALSGTTVSVTPTAPLVWGSHYQFKVSDTVASAAGGKLGASSLTSFDTRMPSWGAPAMVDAGGAPVAVSYLKPSPTGGARNGDTVSLLLEIHGATTRLVARHYAAASGRWTAAVDIQGNSRRAESPELSVDGAGNACAVWEEEQEDGRFVVRAARFDAAAGRWSSPVTISNASGPTSHYGMPAVALSQKGNIIVAWKQYYGGDATKATIDTAYYDTVSQQWTPAHSLQSSTTDTNFPIAAIDARGNAMVLWSQAVAKPGVLTTHAARYDAAAKTWSGNTMIAANDIDSSYVLAFGFDPAGNAIGIWIGDYRFDAKLSTARYNAASNSWGKAEVLRTGDIGPHQIAIDPAGNALLVWSEFNQALGTFAIESRRYQSATGTWSALPSPALSADINFSSNMPLVVDPAGNALTAWVSYWGTSYTMYATRFNVWTGKWDTPVIVATDASAMREPALTVDQSGQAMLQWPQHAGDFFSDAHIRYSRLSGR